MRSKTTKVIILQHGGGELANQLWTFASIYAYCLEKDFDCQNYSFFEYGQYFNIPLKNKLIKFLFFRPFQNHHTRRNNHKNKFWRFIYKIYTKILILIFKNRVISSINSNGQKTYLPPTQENNFLIQLEKDNASIYFTGWLFRNPEGLKKYKNKIIEYFRPKEKYTEPAETRIARARNTYKYIVGVHIRQTDYRTHKNGKYFITENRIRIILDEYLAFFHKKPQETLFIIMSDEQIQKKIFTGLNIITNNGNVVEDLYTLSLCDIIIGSNSSFGNFAAYYGNKPHIILQKETVDWNYYENKNSYFENKYSVMYERI